MQELTSAQMTLLIATSIFGVVFFIVVCAAIIFFFKRVERGDRAETARFTEADDKSDADVTKPQ